MAKISLSQLHECTEIEADPQMKILPARFSYNTRSALDSQLIRRRHAKRRTWERGLQSYRGRSGALDQHYLFDGLRCLFEKTQSQLHIFHM